MEGAEVSYRGGNQNILSRKHTLSPIASTTHIRESLSPVGAGNLSPKLQKLSPVASITRSSDMPSIIQQTTPQMCYPGEGQVLYAKLIDKSSVELSPLIVSGARTLGNGHEAMAWW
jgi:hypothetical protein